MNHHDELEQRLWELEYGLLSDAEGEALRQQISSDPALAAAYDQVRRQLTLVAEAARIDVPPITFEIAPPKTSLSSDEEPRPAVGNDHRSSWYRIRRTMNWIVASAAVLLLGLFGFSQYARNAPADRELAVLTPDAAGSTPAYASEKLLKINIAAPPQLQRNISNNFFFETASADGQPQSANLDVMFQDAEGRVKFDTVVPTNEQGHGMLALPPAISQEVVRMQVASATDFGRAIDTELRSGGETYVTHLNVDRPRYHRGDVVRFRSVTLSRFSLKADREHPIEFSISDPNGVVVENATQTGMTEHGVGNGEMPLGSDILGGQYTVIARSPEGSFSDVRRDFYVQVDRTRQWDVRVAWGASDYQPGKPASAKIEVKDLEGKPATDLAIRAEAFVDGHSVSIPQTPEKTNATGEATVQFDLPESIAYGEGKLFVSVGTEEAIEERIPIRTQKLIVDAFPEGGEMIAGIENRIYLFCHDGVNQPVQARGRVVDSQQREVVTFETKHEGRGAIRMTPVASERYSLQITEPAQTTTDATLPGAEREQGVVLDSGPGVFEAEKPLMLKLRSNSTVASLRIAVSCRGAFVGHRTVNASDFRDGECDVEVPLATEAAGVLRVTLFENTEPIAERLVYREPQRTLHIGVENLQSRYAAGERVQLGLTCHDESGAASPAFLGISVVDESVLRLARAKSPTLATQFWFAGELESPERLEDVNFYLNGSPEAEVALDLLLGTQGWRRFERVAGPQLAKFGAGAAGGFAGMGGGAAKDMSANMAGIAGMSASAASDVVGGTNLLGTVVDTQAELPIYVDNSSIIEEQSRQVVAPEIAQSTPPAKRSSKSSPERAHVPRIVLISIAAVVLSLSLIALIVRLTTNRVVPALAAVAAAIVLLVGMIRIEPGQEKRAVDQLALRESENAAPMAAPIADPAAVPQDAPAPASAERFNDTVNSFEKRSTMTRAVDGIATARTPEPAAKLNAQVASPKASSESRDEGLAETPSTVGAVPDSAPPKPADRSDRIEVAPAAPPVPPPAAAVPPPPAPTIAATKDPSEEKVAPELEKAIERTWAARSVENDFQPNAPRPEVFAGKGNTVLKDQLQYSFEDASDVDSKSFRARVQKGIEQNQRSRAMSRDAKLLRQRNAISAAQSANSPLGIQKSLGDSQANFVRRFYVHQRTEAGQEAQFDRTETLYWQPLLIVGADGRAQIDFDTSDAATTFRLMIDAHQDGRLGGVSAEIKTDAQDQK